MSTSRARFRIGQLVHHKLFDYRGVVFDVDADFQGDDDWYQTMARTRPPKTSPWYHVLVHEAVHTTYVAERNLRPDLTGQPISHPALGQLFGELRDGIYTRHGSVN
ncbi:MAG: heat shock protein HspQ [Hyphomicrobiales bacterium]|nr:heat shock protein HspQ [Hyphomicrobiales bacterium]